MSMWKLSCPNSRFASTLSLTGAVVALAAAVALAQAPAGKQSSRLKAQYAQIPLTFEANQGQTASQAQFLARSRGTIVFLTARGMVVKTKQGAVGMRFAGATAAPAAQGRQAVASPVHYWLGSGLVSVRSYRKVDFAKIYPGVGVTYYGHDGQVEFDLKLAPHASPAAVQMAFRGASPYLGADGSLTLAHGVSLRTPLAYQSVNGRRHAVRVQYRLLPDDRVGLVVGAYDANRTLIVDPILAFASLLGGTSYNQANAVAVDSKGNGYVAGFTISTDFPVQSAFQAKDAPGSFSTSSNDAFVTEISADGKSLIYSTYLGGNGDDEATGIAVDSTGAAYVTGFTNSTNFPTTAAVPPIQAANAGGYDAFVTKFAVGGAKLDYSTYLGGTGDDKAAAIAVDPQGEAFITGTTSSTDFPVSATAPQKTMAGKTDAFVAGISAAGTSTLYATYLGGSDIDNGNAIAVDQTGNVVVGGATASTNFPVTAGAHQPQIGGNFDGFIAMIPRAGTSIGWATYLGGSGADAINAVTVDTADNVYVAGSTNSSNLFCPFSSCASSFAGNGDAFVAKFNSSGSQLVWGAYLGAAPSGVATAIAVDSTDDVYIAGYTSSASLPATSNATQNTPGGAVDGFLAKLGPAGPNSANPFLFYSYLGGRENDAVNGMGIDANGDIDLVGTTSSNNFPVTAGTFQTSLNSSTDAFVARYVVAAQGVFSPPAMGFPAQAPTVKSAAQTVTFTNGGELALIIKSITTTGPYSETDTCSANNSTLQPTQSCTISVVFTPTATGTQNGTLVITDNSPSGSETLPLSGSGGDFSVSVTPINQTIAAGASASFEVDLAPATGYTGVVKLSCTGIGTTQNATCTPSPASLTMNGTSTSIATMTVTTTVRPAIVPWFSAPPSGPWFWIALFGLALALTGAIYGLRMRGMRRRVGWVGTAVLLGLSFAAAGCGGKTTNQGTPAGNYSLTFTGTAGQATHSQKVNLTVN
ncbi:MAG: DUF1573 domain-containing protein [Acidobacteria bacterium]|nr:MAG: DUF1573 domain-containing protein [Acidobacteriota bacterium]